MGASRVSRSSLFVFSPPIFLLMVLMLFWPAIEQFGWLNILAMVGRFLIVAMVVLVLSFLGGLLIVFLEKGESP